MKVGIVIITYNISSELFALQIEAIRKFCKDDFEIMVIDNSTDMKMSVGIQYHAGQLAIPYKKTMASSYDGSDSHSFAANFSYLMLKDHFDAMFYLDHDCLPIKPFSVIEILGEDKIMAGIGQHDLYMWPGCVMWRNDKIDKELISFNPDHERRLDTGAGLSKVIEKYGKENCIFFNEVYEQNPNFTGKYNYYALINDGMFLHVVNSSNWSGEMRHEERINSMVNLLREKIDSYVA